MQLRAGPGCGWKSYRRLLLLSCSALLLFGCSSKRKAPGPATLTVFAASSLTEAFGELERSFERRYPGVDVSCVFAGSQVLRLQLEEGARADVFASANTEHMSSLAAQGLIAEHFTFANNALALIVPTDNPAGIEVFADLPKSIRLVVGLPNVPVGKYTRELLERSAVAYGPEFEQQVLMHVASEESNVRLVRAKVELGDADAAIVYVTDASTGSGVRVIAVPEEVNPLIRYEIGALHGSPNQELAGRWLDFVRSDSARRLLSERGFLAP